MGTPFSRSRRKKKLFRRQSLRSTIYFFSTHLVVHEGPEIRTINREMSKNAIQLNVASNPIEKWTPNIGTHTFVILISRRMPHCHYCAFWSNSKNREKIIKHVMKEPCYCYQQYNRTDLNIADFPNPDPIFLDDDPLGKLLSNESFDLNGTLAELVNSTPLVSSRLPLVNFFPKPVFD